MTSEIKEKLRKTVSNLQGSHAVKHVAERIADRRVDQLHCGLESIQMYTVRSKLFTCKLIQGRQCGGTTACDARVYIKHVCLPAIAQTPHHCVRSPSFPVVHSPVRPERTGLKRPPCRVRSPRSKFPHQIPGLCGADTSPPSWPYEWACPARG